MIKINVKSHLELLGCQVRERVTGLKGTVVSIGFDLYGCIQAIVHPGLNKEGKLEEPIWFDVSRLEVIDPEPCMPRPNFEFGPVAEGLQGCADKPRSLKP